MTIDATTPMTRERYFYLLGNNLRIRNVGFADAERVLELSNPGGSWFNVSRTPSVPQSPEMKAFWAGYHFGNESNFVTLALPAELLAFFKSQDPLQAAIRRVMNFMDSLSPATSPRVTTTDAPMVHLNSWGRWCVKFDTNEKRYCAFGETLIEALNKLVDEPTIKTLVQS